MARGIEFISRESQGVTGSVCLMLYCVTVILLLTSQPVRSEDLHNTTVNTQYDCAHCMEVTDCIVVCGDCEAPSYKFQFVYCRFCLESRKKRQLPPDQVSPAAVTTPTTTTTPPTTTVKNAWICKNCSVAGCKKCIDFVETPTCEACQDGYHLNNVTNTCYMEPELEESLSGTAIAGIVIAVVCVVGIAIVIALFVCRKFRGSRDVTGRSQILKDFPKDDKKSSSSFSKERKELQELGEAPPPPAQSNDYQDMQHKYDPLDTQTQNDPQLYLPMQHEEDALYLNTAAVENEFNQAGGLYENTQQANNQAVSKSLSANNDTSKHPGMAKSQESVDYYEPVGTAVPQKQEIYGNDDSVMLVENCTAKQDDVYLNEDVDNVYQNASFL